MRPLYLLGSALVLAAPVPVLAVDLGLPIDCTLGETCFIQQFPDLATGPEVADPWCGRASYDGHDGTDFRIRTMTEVQSGVPVIAAADGVVVGLRDGEPDHLIASEAEAAEVANVECGNGVLLDNGNGLETQYCHLRQGSVAVSEGQSVQRGDVLGYVGASGLAAFPHVHLSVRQDGVAVDPTSGRRLDEGCSMSPGTTEPLWDMAVIPQLRGWEGEILDLGFAGAPVEHNLLSQAPPPVPDANSDAFVGWAWFSNLQDGDAITLRLLDGQGGVVAENTMVVEGNKADYSAFAGKRGAPAPGDYTVEASVAREGTVVIEGSEAITVK